MEGPDPTHTTALCAMHPDRPAVDTCSRCGNFFCPDCRGPDSGPFALCINCNQVRSYVPWEDDALGLWDRYWLTIRRSVAEYQTFARELPVQGGLGRPLLYAMIPSTLSSMFIAFAAAGMAGLFVFPMASSGGSFGDNPILILVLAFLAYFVGGAVAYLGYTFLWALVLFVSSRLFGATKVTYEALFRIVCYSSGLNVLSFIPLVGMLVMLYHVVLMTVCVTHKADVGVGRSIGIVVAPMAVSVLFCCGGYALLIAATLGMG